MRDRKYWDEVARRSRKPLLGGRIAAVVHEAPESTDDSGDPLYAWFLHLNKTLACPFDARVCRGADDFGNGDRIQVLALVGHGDMEGVVVKYKRGGRRGEMALSRLEAVGRRSENALWIDAYRLWRDTVIDETIDDLLSQEGDPDGLDGFFDQGAPLPLELLNSRGIPPLEGRPPWESSPELPSPHDLVGDEAVPANGTPSPPPPVDTAPPRKAPPVPESAAPLSGEASAIPPTDDIVAAEIPKEAMQETPAPEPPAPAPSCEAPAVLLEPSPAALPDISDPVPPPAPAAVVEAPSSRTDNTETQPEREEAARDPRRDPFVGALLELGRLHREQEAEIADLRRELTEQAQYAAARYQETVRLRGELEQTFAESETLRRRVAELEAEARTFCELADDARRDRDFHVAEHRRLQVRAESLAAQLAARNGRRDGGAYPLPTAYDAVPAWVKEHLAGRLLLLPRALRGLAEAQFHDVGLVCRALLLLANEYRSMRKGDLPREAFEAGLEDLRLRCSPSVTPTRAGEEGDEYFVPYPPGTLRRRFLEMHLRNNATTRYPPRCLAIYFLWDETLEQVAVGWLPGHLDIRSSN